MLSNSAPVNARPSVSSPSAKMPIRRQMAIAVSLLSPVMTMTRIPAARHSSMHGLTSCRGGSSMPATPTNVIFCSTSTNDLGSLLYAILTHASTEPGLSTTAMARHRSVWAPVPYSLTLLMMVVRMASVRSTVLPLTRTAVHRASTFSGAPLTNICGTPPFSIAYTDMDFRSRVNSSVNFFSYCFMMASLHARARCSSDMASRPLVSSTFIFSTSTVRAVSVGSPILANLPFLNSRLDELQSEHTAASSLRVGSSVILAGAPSSVVILPRGSYVSPSTA
mmetsp:Transcript_20244/g.52518  ORF Transcript_20244/g.52518 Transcript_20244/m.52518 type:complete len:279 (+) Transcript_20244:1476-2312(+)